MLFSRRRRCRIRFRHQANSDFRSLNACGIAQKISERNGFCDSVSGVRVVIRCFNPITKTGQGILYGLRGEARRLGTGYEITLLTDSPFAGVTDRFDIALELKNGCGFFSARQADFERTRHVLFRPCLSTAFLNVSAICSLLRPSLASKMILARSTSRCSLLPRRLQSCSAFFYSSDR